MMYKKIVYIVLISVFMYSCTTRMPIQMYVVDGGYSQYYIPESKSSKNGVDISLSLSFRNNPSLEYPVVINYSVISPDRKMTAPSSVSFVTLSNEHIILEQESVLFREIRKNKGIIRVTNKMDRNTFLYLLHNNPEFLKIAYQDGTEITFALSKDIKNDLSTILLYVESL